MKYIFSFKKNLKRETFLKASSIIFPKKRECLVLKINNHTSHELAQN